jgi:hypothetical protein
LTGYIDKAQEKQYIAQAREHLIAARTVITEAYAKGEFSSPDALNYANTGYSKPNHSTRQKLWFLTQLSVEVFGNYEAYDNQVAKLLNTTYPAWNTPGHWMIFFAGDTGPSSTAFNADGYVYFYFPETATSGKSVIAVTYKLKPGIIGTNYAGFYNQVLMTGTYDAKEGHHIYHLTYG